VTNIAARNGRIYLSTTHLGIGTWAGGGGGVDQIRALRLPNVFGGFCFMWVHKPPSLLKVQCTYMYTQLHPHCTAVLLPIPHFLPIPGCTAVTLYVYCCTLSPLQ
jgi:hypothetical protein